jgi:hypothetical protein
MTACLIPYKEPWMSLNRPSSQQSTSLHSISIRTSHSAFISTSFSPLQSTASIISIANKASRLSSSESTAASSTPSLPRHTAQANSITFKLHLPSPCVSELPRDMLSAAASTTFTVLISARQSAKRDTRFKSELSWLGTPAKRTARPTPSMPHQLLPTHTILLRRLHQTLKLLTTQCTPVHIISHKSTGQLYNDGINEIFRFVSAEHDSLSAQRGVFCFSQLHSGPGSLLDGGLWGHS